MVWNPSTSLVYCSWSIKVSYGIKRYLLCLTRQNWRSILFPAKIQLTESGFKLTLYTVQVMILIINSTKLSLFLSFNDFYIQNEILCFKVILTPFARITTLVYIFIFYIFYFIPDWSFDAFNYLVFYNIGYENDGKGIVFLYWNINQQSKFILSLARSILKQYCTKCMPCYI